MAELADRLFYALVVFSLDGWSLWWMLDSWLRPLLPIFAQKTDEIPVEDCLDVRWFVAAGAEKFGQPLQISDGV